MRLGSGLALTRYRVTFAALEPPDLPAYLRSTPRGAFGHAFRAAAGPRRHRSLWISLVRASSSIRMVLGGVHGSRPD